MHNPSAPSQGHNQKPAGPHAPHRPTDSPGRASRSGRQPAKPTGPHSPTVQRTRPAGQAGPGGSPQNPQGLTAPPSNGLARQGKQVRAAARKPRRASQPPPSNRLARQGKPSRSGRQPAKTRRTPPAFPSNALRPVGHASQSFPARRRGKKMESCFDRLRRPKHPSHPESAGFAGAVRGASPNFGRSNGPGRTPDPPYTALPNEAPTFRAPPKIPYLIRILGSIY